LRKQISLLKFQIQFHDFVDASTLDCEIKNLERSARRV
jgi:hypothetical protein